MLDQLGLTKIPVTVWVDDLGRMRKMTMTMDLSALGDQLGAPAGIEPKLEITLEMYDFGVPVSDTSRHDPPGTLGPVEQVIPSVGWGVLHLFYRVDRERAERDPGAAKHVRDAFAALEADGHQALALAMLGHKADLGVIALGPDLARLQRFQNELLAAPLEPVVLVRLAHRAVGVRRDRGRGTGAARRSEEGLGGRRARRAARRVARSHRALPREPCAPASARRSRAAASTRCRSGGPTDANWFELPFDERKELMAGHARVGRTYAGRVLQLITGSTGIDDWEWGVTLLADDPAALKEIVYEMRFDPVSARYAEFGPFFTGPRARPGRRVRTCRPAAEDDAQMTQSTTTAIRLFVSIPEELVERPLIYEMIKQFDVVPSIRRANVEAHSAWVILELAGPHDARDQAIAYLEGLGCTVNRMEGDVVAG